MTVERLCQSNISPQSLKEEVDMSGLLQFDIIERLKREMDKAKDPDNAMNPVDESSVVSDDSRKRESPRPSSQRIIKKGSSDSSSHLRERRVDAEDFTKQNSLSSSNKRIESSRSSSRRNDSGSRKLTDSVHSTSRRRRLKKRGESDDHPKRNEDQLRRSSHSNKSANSHRSASSNSKPTEKDVELLRAELNKQLEEEQMLISLQMQLLVQLEKLKSAIEQSESEDRLARLASQQAKVVRLMRRRSADDNIDDEVITIQVRA